MPYKNEQLTLYLVSLLFLTCFVCLGRTNIQPMIGIKPPAPRIVDVNENVSGNMRSRNLRQKLQSMMIKHLSGRNSVWSKYKKYGSNLESKRVIPIRLNFRQLLVY